MYIFCEVWIIRDWYKADFYMAKEYLKWLENCLNYCEIGVKIESHAKIIKNSILFYKYALHSWKKLHHNIF